MEASILPLTCIYICLVIIWQSTLQIVIIVWYSLRYYTLKREANVLEYEHWFHFPSMSITLVALVFQHIITFLTSLKSRLKAYTPFICGLYIDTKILKALYKLYMFSLICKHRVLMRLDVSHYHHFCFIHIYSQSTTLAKCFLCSK